MKLIKKYQAGNTVQRDATRMKAPPPLIKKKEARSLPNNQTYLSPKPQQSEYFDKQSRINATKREVSENLEKSKYNNFWTQPYSNFTGEQAYGLATNLVKESMYAGAGEALGTLLVGAIGKVATKLKKSKDSIGGMVGLDTGTTKGAQNMALSEARNEYYNVMFPNNKVHPDMVKRAKNIGWELETVPNEGKLGLVDRSDPRTFYGSRFSRAKRRQFLKRNTVANTDETGNTFVIEKNVCFLNIYFNIYFNICIIDNIVIISMYVDRKF